MTIYCGLEGHIKLKEKWLILLFTDNNFWENPVGKIMECLQFAFD